MSTFKRCKVIMLPTNDNDVEASIYTNLVGRLYSFPFQPKHFQENFKGHHLYILSKDPIKVGDWYLYDGSVVKQETDLSSKFVKDRVRHEKIIATTDPVISNHNCTNCGNV